MNSDSRMLQDTSLDDHPPERAIMPSQARQMPPLDLLYSCFIDCLQDANVLHLPAPPNNVLLRACVFYLSAALFGAKLWDLSTYGQIAMCEDFPRGSAFFSDSKR